jgi:hypothetical protein
MNELEKSLMPPFDGELEFYFETVTPEAFRRHIHEIKLKAADETDATRKIEAIKQILKEQP